MSPRGISDYTYSLCPQALYPFCQSRVECQTRRAQSKKRAAIAIAIDSRATLLRRDDGRLTVAETNEKKGESRPLAPAAEPLPPLANSPLGAAAACARSAAQMASLRDR